MRIPSLSLLHYVFYALVLLAAPLSAKDAETVSIENEFIKVTVERETSRFYVETTGGDPANPNDNNSELMYRYSPPTSFTTIALDDGKKVYVYGEDSKGRYLRQAEVQDNAIIAVWEVDNCRITQTLSFSPSPSSPERADSVQIRYEVENRSSTIKKVGIRILLDTALGEKDGTPYFVPGYGKVNDEREFLSDDMPQYWYSFDNLDNPKIRSMGTLRGPGTILPDRLVFANWKKLDEAKWNYRLRRGASFKRSWFGARDSAVALYYNSREISPDQRMVTSTLYGMYATDRIEGDVWSTVIGGSQIAYETNPFVISADIQNISDKRLRDVSVTLSFSSNIAAQLTNTRGRFLPLTVDVGRMGAGDIETFTWPFVANEGVEGAFWAIVSVRGKLGEQEYPSTMQRRIFINRITESPIAHAVIIDKPVPDPPDEDPPDEDPPDEDPPDEDPPDEDPPGVDPPDPLRRELPDLASLNELIRKINEVDRSTAGRIIEINKILAALAERMADSVYTDTDYGSDITLLEALFKELGVLEERLEAEIQSRKNGS